MLLGGCAGPHREFRDGAPVRAPVVEPRTAYTPAGAGLPEYWGQPVEAVERSPHARVLPQTPETRREDGIWAGGRRPPEDSVLLGFPLPVPDDASDLAKAVTRQCARDMTDAMTRAGVLLIAQTLDGTHRRCLGARLFEHCMSFARSVVTEIESTSAERFEEARKTAQQMDRFAKDYSARACGYVDMRGTPDRAFVATGVEYDRWAHGK